VSDLGIMLEWLTEKVLMATLKIDDLTPDVIGTPSWGRAGQHGAVPFIAAQVRVPVDRRADAQPRQRQCSYRAHAQ
jgi:hypothetical protein